MFTFADLLCTGTWCHASDATIKSFIFHLLRIGLILFFPEKQSPGSPPVKARIREGGNGKNGILLLFKCICIEAIRGYWIYKPWGQYRKRNGEERRRGWRVQSLLLVSFCLVSWPMFIYLFLCSNWFLSCSTWFIFEELCSVVPVVEILIFLLWVFYRVMVEHMFSVI